MPGNLQPLVNNQRIVNADGTPTEYFIKWAQIRQLDISGSLTTAEAQQLIDDWAAARSVGAGVALDGGGPLSADITIDHSDSAVTPGVYGDASNVAQITVDQQGHVTGVTEVAISGGGGGAPWYFSPPSASQFTLIQGAATPLTLTDDTDVGLLVQSGTMTAPDNLRLAVETLTNPTLDWELVAHFSNIVLEATNFAGVGVYIRDSVGGRVSSIVSANTGTLQTNKWNSMTSFNSNYNTPTIRYPVNWFRIRSVGAQLFLDISATGKSWMNLVTTTPTNFLANRADQVGFGLLSSRTTFPIEFACDYYSLTGPAV